MISVRLCLCVCQRNDAGRSRDAFPGECKETVHVWSRPPSCKGTRETHTHTHCMKRLNVIWFFKWFLHVNVSVSSDWHPFKLKWNVTNQCFVFRVYRCHCSWSVRCSVWIWFCFGRVVLGHNRHKPHIDNNSLAVKMKGKYSGDEV